MDLRDKLAYGIWSDGSNYKAFDGIYEIVDDGHDTRPPTAA